MTILRGLAVSILMVSIIAAVFLIGCSSKETADTKTAVKTAVEDTKAAAETATEAVEEAGEALASFANPKEGICPVCQMKVEQGSIEVATIMDKKYACCSASCVATLAENPDKYLMDSAEGHEGHGH